MDNASHYLLWIKTGKGCSRGSPAESLRPCVSKGWVTMMVPAKTRLPRIPHPPGMTPASERPHYCPVTIRTASADFCAPAVPAALLARHWLSVLPAVHSRPAYDTRSMCSAEELATAQCASCQP